MIKKLIAFIIGLILLFIICFEYAYKIEPNMLITVHKELKIPNWNDNLSGLKIALISDLHVFWSNTTYEKLQKIVKEINSNNPDLIIIAGDFESLTIDKSKDNEKFLETELSKLKAPLGVISVLGNHDYYPEGVIERVLKNSNVTLLKDETVIKTYKNEKFQISGFHDMWHKKLCPACTIKDNKIPTIAISHNPDIFPDMPDYVSLTLSGHTHGGEIYIPFIGSFTVPSVYHQKYRKGYIIEKNKHLYVTSGIGTLSGFRFLNPPEIVILKLTKQTKIPKDTKVPRGIQKNYIPKIREIIE